MKKISDQELNQLITQISNKLSYQFKFGYYDADDIKQEISILILEGIESYEPNRGKLVNFLYVHVKNRLRNLRRKKFERWDKPCLNCPFKAWDKKRQKCTKFENTKDCELLAHWLERNSRKKNIAAPVRIEEINTNTNSFLLKTLNSIDALHQKEVFEYIDIHLPVVYRKDYVMFLNGIKLSKNRIDALFKIIKEIMDSYE